VANSARTVTAFTRRSVSGWDSARAAHQALQSECADPHSHGDKEGAHADHRNDILYQLGHLLLLFLICSQFVLFLFKCQREPLHPAAATRRNRFDSK
jgi:hypothetical protein